MDLAIFATYLMSGAFPTPEDGFAYISECGVKCADISEGWLPTYSIRQHVEMLNEAGITPKSLITHPDIVTSEKQVKRKNLDTVKEYIDQLEKFNIPLIMVAPKVSFARSLQEFDDMREKMIESLTDVVEYAKGSGVKVTIENQSGARRADTYMHDIRKILDAVPELGYVFDAGNFFFVDDDAIEAYELLRDRMVHAHFKDWKWDPYGADIKNSSRFTGVALGAGGLIPLRELAGRMCRDKYDGSVIIEINSPYTREDLAESAEFLKEIFDPILQAQFSNP